jgi:hypothetical protein
MSKMGSHDPFGYLEYKLWPKEGPGIKLPIWLPTTKSWKSSRFLCLQVACDISLESCWRGLQFCFRPHLNQRFSHKVMGCQSCKIPNFWNFYHLGVSKQNDIWVLAWWPNRGECCEFMFAHGSSVHQMCSSNAFTNLLFGLCRSVWVIDLLVNLSSPHLGALAHPSTSKMLWGKEHALTPSPSAIVIFWFAIECIKELGGVSNMAKWMKYSCHMVKIFHPNIPTMWQKYFLLVINSCSQVRVLMTLNTL